MTFWHQHKWEVVAVTNGTFVLLGGIGTNILQRCECGKVQTETINGYWTLEQVRGEHK